DLVMIGESYGTRYLGSYYLSENVRVGENRLEIEELSEKDSDPSVITGGYLLQNASQLRNGSPDRFYTRRGAEWGTHTPSFDTEENGQLGSSDGEEEFAGRELGDAYKNAVQQEYIQGYIQKAEDILFEGGTAYRDIIDVESAAKYWLVQEISMNSDAFGTGSTYIYKYRDRGDEEGKLFWGPLWDFDYAWNNRITTSGLDCGHLWMRPMFCDRDEGGFVRELHRQWPVLREALLTLTEEGGLLDMYYEETMRSAEQDHLLYHDYDKEFSYREEVDDLRRWIIERTEWVDENFSIVDRMVHKVTFMDGETVFDVDYVAYDERVSSDRYHPEKDGFMFVGWADEGGDLIGEEEITEDRVFSAVFASDKALRHGEDIAFSKDSDVIRYSGFFKTYGIQYEVIPQDAEDKRVTWTSSDESFATVDDNGIITFNGTGEAVFTARLRYGRSRQFTFAVVSDDLPYAVSVNPEEDVIKMVAGTQHTLCVSTDPSPAAAGSFSYESDDESIVTVGEFGILTAAAPGKTKVHVRIPSHDQNGNDIELEATVTVIVMRMVRKEQVMLVTLCVMCAVIAAVFLDRERKGKYVPAVILKGLASLCFVAIGKICSPGTHTAALILCGLVVGCVADVLLNLRMVFSKKGQLIFLVGILVFLTGHILYLAAVLGMEANVPVCFAAAAVLTALLMIWIFRRITAKPAFKIFGVVYIGAIVLLNCSAVWNLVTDPSAFTAVFAAGAVLFLISDIVLILNTFGKEFRQSLRYTNIGLYYAGQLLIAFSLLLLRK
ncbi:MAG: Ig-like domain-containing protein, partial [Oscillospiraceae bacterium]|nr:Ig-like domain-containing protein [Oscillospiraceae bacterium]